MNILVDDDPKKLLDWRPWTPPTPESQVLARTEDPGPGDHDWRLAGTKRDAFANTTHFLWVCEKCHRRTTTETASREGECFADQSLPGPAELRRAGIDEDCRQAAVDAVHDR